MRLSPRALGSFWDSGSPVLARAVAQIVQDAPDDVTAARRCFVAVRDRIRYDPFSFFARFEFDWAQYHAEHIWATSFDRPESGAFCTPKALALAAALRVAGFPAKLGLCFVTNHLSTPKLQSLMRTDVFFHGYTAVSLDGGRSYLKITPTFDAALCARFNVQPLEWDGLSDCIFHPFDTQGRKHMEYQSYLGEFDDFPTDYFREVMIQTYPHFGPHPRQAWLAMRESASSDPASEAAMPAPAPAGPSSPTPSTSTSR